MGVDPGDEARAALGRRVARARLIERVPIVYDPYLAGRSVERATGVANTPDRETLSWTAIVKRTRGPGLRAARRELAVYRHGVASDDTTVAIDWENTGRGPLGVDLARLVVGSVRRGEASSEQLAELESVVLAGYLDGLPSGGVGVEEDIRRAYRLAVGLRWHVVLGTIRTSLDADVDGFRGSRRDEPREEALRHLLTLSRYILDVGLDLPR